MSKTIVIKFEHILVGKFFSKKQLTKKDRKNLRRNPKKIEKKSYKATRFLKYSFRKKGFFSISHKDNFCAVGFSKKSGFGIDLEVLKKRNFKAIVEFCFNSDEIELYKQSKDKLTTFYKIFTAKEAILKMRNLNFSDFQRVGYCSEKKTFCDEDGKKIYIYYKIVQKHMLLCVSFKEKRDIIFKKV